MSKEQAIQIIERVLASRALMSLEEASLVMQAIQALKAKE